MRMLCPLLLLCACSSTSSGRGAGDDASGAPTSDSGANSTAGGTTSAGANGSTGDPTSVTSTGDSGAAETTGGTTAGGAASAVTTTSESTQESSTVSTVSTSGAGAGSGAGGDGSGGSGGGGGSGGNSGPPTTYCRSFYNSSGGQNPCYIGTDGMAHCIVNDGSTITLSEVPGTVVSVTGWDYTTRACAVNDAGAVYCGDYGSLSVWVSSGATEVSGLANGPCAIVNGSVQCDSVSVPDAVDTGAGNVTLLGCYSDGCCAATDEPKLYCWGDTVENFGVDTSEPFDVPLPAGKQVLQIGAGQVHVCVLLEGGQVQCWGQDWNGQLGGLGANMAEGATVATGAVGVASGQFHTCIAFDDGTVECAGLAGVHGAGQNSMTLAPVPDVTTAIAITAGRYASCALLDDASVKCWGDYGPEAAGSNETLTPIDVTGVPVAPCE